MGLFLRNVILFLMGISPENYLDRTFKVNFLIISFVASSIFVISLNWQYGITDNILFLPFLFIFALYQLKKKWS